MPLLLLVSQPSQLPPAAARFSASAAAAACRFPASIYVQRYKLRRHVDRKTSKALPIPWRCNLQLCRTTADTIVYCVQSGRPAAQNPFFCCNLDVFHLCVRYPSEEQDRGLWQAFVHFTGFVIASHVIVLETVNVRRDVLPSHPAHLRFGQLLCSARVNAMKCDIWMQVACKRWSNIRWAESSLQLNAEQPDENIQAHIGLSAWHAPVLFARHMTWHTHSC